MKGIIISGKFGELLVRQKSGEPIEIGELLVSEDKDKLYLMQAYDLLFGSQLSSANLELVSGMRLEEDSDLMLMDKELRNYTLAHLKNLITIHDKGAHSTKSLPAFFSEVREVTKKDLSFLSTPDNPLFLGSLRSGSKTLDVPIHLNGEKTLSHHILIPATTGKGKSNLCSVMLWEMAPKDYAGVLVLDPHDEYYGRNRTGLKDHPHAKVVYYSPEPPAGARTLKIHLKHIRPSHFNGVVQWSSAQKDALNAYYRRYKENWIEAIVANKEAEGFMEGTLAVVKRKLLSLLDLSYADTLHCHGVFDAHSGSSTIQDICHELEQGHTVILDTSTFSGTVEILIGSLVTSEIFSMYKRYKTKGTLKDKPVISILLEEAPRVLGREVLEKGPNIFSTIAREGRKFKVGLIAVTQLPSLIPRQILANMNTKIILGIEMAPERQAVIESAAQDLSSDGRAIASLDKGEAIVTSNFARFAIPLRIPLFSEHISISKTSEKLSFEGISLS